MHPTHVLKHVSCSIYVHPTHVFPICASDSPTGARLMLHICASNPRLSYLCIRLTYCNTSDVSYLCIRLASFVSMPPTHVMEHVSYSTYVHPTSTYVHPTQVVRICASDSRTAARLMFHTPLSTRSLYATITPLPRNDRIITNYRLLPDS